MRRSCTAQLCGGQAGFTGCLNVKKVFISKTFQMGRSGTGHALHSCVEGKEVAMNCVLAKNTGCGEMLQGNPSNSSRRQPSFSKGLLVLAKWSAQEVSDWLTQLQGQDQHSLQPGHAAQLITSNNYGYRAIPGTGLCPIRLQVNFRSYRQAQLGLQVGDGRLACSYAGRPPCQQGRTAQYAISLLHFPWLLQEFLQFLNSYLQAQHCVLSTSWELGGCLSWTQPLEAK